MLYVCMRGVMDVVFLFVLCRWSCMGSMSVSSCRCCMFVSCVHPVAVIYFLVSPIRFINKITITAFYNHSFIWTKQAKMQ